MPEPTKDENLKDLQRQAQKAGRAERPFPKLSVLTRAVAHPELQRAFELYDQQVEEHQRSRQTG